MRFLSVFDEDDLLLSLTSAGLLCARFFNVFESVSSSSVPNTSAQMHCAEALDTPDRLRRVDINSPSGISRVGFEFGPGRFGIPGLSRADERAPCVDTAFCLGDVISFELSGTLCLGDVGSDVKTRIFEDSTSVFASELEVT